MRVAELVSGYQHAYRRDGISGVDELVMVIIDKSLTFAIKLPHLWVGRHVKTAICYVIDE